MDTNVSGFEFVSIRGLISDQSKYNIGVPRARERQSSMGPRPVNAKRGRHKSNVPTTDTAFSLFGVSDRSELTSSIQFILVLQTRLGLR